MSKKIEEQIKEALKEEVFFDEVEKKEIWGNIENELFDFEKKRGSKVMKKNRKKFSMLGVVAATMLVLVFVGVGTDTGDAMVDKIKSMFVPEKEIVQILEGSEEKINLELNSGSKADYIIYIDQDRYKLIVENGVDKIVTLEPLPQDFPEVSLKIEQVLDKKPLELLEELEDSVVEQYEKVVFRGEVVEPLKGWLIEAKKTNNEWNTPIIKILIVDNDQGGSFLITQRLFLEAEEGHGLRFEEMLKEFRIVNE